MLHFHLSHPSQRILAESPFDSGTGQGRWEGDGEALGVLRALRPENGEVTEGKIYAAGLGFTPGGFRGALGLCPLVHQGLFRLFISISFL